MVRLVKSETEFVQDSGAEQAQILRCDVVSANTVVSGEVRVEAIRHIARYLGRVAAEDPVFRGEIVVDPREILVLIQNRRHGSDYVDVQDIFRSELRQRQVGIDEVLRIAINAAGRNDIRDASGRVGSAYSVRR